ncbi:MAG: sigma 54-interacting transcriptional regulator [Deltaproteobacteria bacterium]|nr:sigma 54-interacting transcriptional regulator [Deltaproteobacteria bacterium]
MSGPQDLSIPEGDTTARRRRGEARPAVCSIRVVLGDQVSAHPIVGDTELALGRGGDIVIPHVNISRRHVALRIGGSLEACDLGSTNATTLHGSPLDPNVWIPIRVGDILVVGGEALVMLHDGEARSVPTRHIGREWLERGVADGIAEHDRSSTPFGIVTVSSRSSRRWMDVIGGVLLERDRLVVLSDTEAAVILGNRSSEQVHAVARALEGHLGRVGANARVRIRLCPADGTTVDALIGEPASDNRLHRTTMRPTGPLVRNPAMQKLYALVDEVAPSHVNVLILGETGVGKDVLAHALHERSPRASAAFVSMNCGAMPETLLESELFGHERGAFTGAVTSKPGLLETAEGGTIFLDEVGEMPLATQAKFLRVLEDRTVRRVGALKPRPIDVRVVAATNRDLPKDIAEGRFRADLYYRLNGLSFVVPPLRERPDEIAPLAAHFILNAASVLGKPPPKLSVEAKLVLESYRWPGNIRELRNVIERAVLLARDRVITPDLLPAELTQRDTPPPRVSSTASRPESTSHLPSLVDHEETQNGFHDDAYEISTGSIPVLTDAGRILEEADNLERQRIVEALAKCNGNQTRAAQMLGITRRVLINRILRYDLPRPRAPQRGGEGNG